MRHVTQFCADSQTPCFQYIRHTKKPSEEGLRSSAKTDLCPAR
ncbi:hypothetical protein VCBJG01_1436 [Vibrio cholerae BJG-01]|nr:hypothetical protein VCBJG01_1436 [Vibrio cholerae BJG-01]